MNARILEGGREGDGEIERVCVRVCLRVCGRTKESKEHMWEGEKERQINTKQ